MLASYSTNNVDVNFLTHLQALKKVKVFLAHAMLAYTGNGGTDPSILKLGTTCRSPG
jgi:hypothetical protein